MAKDWTVLSENEMFFIMDVTMTVYVYALYIIVIYVNASSNKNEELKKVNKTKQQKQKQTLLERKKTCHTTVGINVGTIIILLSIKTVVVFIAKIVASDSNSRKVN